MSPSTEPFQILETLRAEAPHPEHREKLMLFGRFVGAWDMRVIFYDEGGEKIYDQPGRWAFSWVLDGRAIQDVLIYPNPDRAMKYTAGDRRIGTTLRYYDPAQNSWRVIWLGVVSGNLGVMVGREVGDEIWIEEKELDESLTRWIFTEISSNRFHWKGTVSSDQGKTWRIDQEMFAQRSLT
jgi:hypothetical protein